MRTDIPRAMACALFLCAVPASAETVVNNADSGKTVSVMLGQPLVVQLYGKHGSGFYWRIDADPTPQLVLSGRVTQSVAVTGAPETTIFTYTTGAAGEVMFRASYLKPGAPFPSKSDVAILVEVTQPPEQSVAQPAPQPAPSPPRRD